MLTCDSCGLRKPGLVAAARAGKYYPAICQQCLGQDAEVVSSGSASYERRRGYEDYAQDTVQPYDAMGRPRPEFWRLYPKTAEGMFTDAEIEDIKRKI